MDGKVSVLQIDGMTCQNCVQKIETSLKKLASVQFVKVGLEEMLSVAYCKTLIIIIIIFVFQISGCQTAP